MIEWFTSYRSQEPNCSRSSAILPWDHFWRTLYNLHEVYKIQSIGYDRLNSTPRCSMEIGNLMKMLEIMLVRLGVRMCKIHSGRGNYMKRLVGWYQLKGMLTLFHSFIVERLISGWRSMECRIIWNTSHTSLSGGIRCIILSIISIYRGVLMDLDIGLWIRFLAIWGLNLLDFMRRNYMFIRMLI